MNLAKSLFYAFFSIWFILFSSPVYAENVIQLTGGNYVYAENGQLTFNLDNTLFRKRKWQYNELTDSAETTFLTRSLDFKTKHSSDFHGYQNHALMHYRSHKVALPVALGLAVRIGGKILAETIPPIVTKCVTNLKCATASAVTAAHLCAINFGFGQSFLPAGICQKAEEDGWNKNADGTYSKSGQIKFYAMRGNMTLAPHVPKFYPSSLNSNLTDSQISNMFEPICQKTINSFNSNEKLSGNYQYSYVRVSKYRASAYIDCYFKKNVSDFDYVQFVYDGISDQKMQIVDLEDYVSRDFKENPNDYVNDAGQIGKDTLANVKVDNADFFWESGSGFSIVSSPYRDKQGDTKQDIVQIDKSQPDINAKPSGTASESAPGVSKNSNPVTVISQSRPDLEIDSKPSEDNQKNGINGSKLGSPNGSEKGDENGDECDENSDKVSCARLGTIEDDGSNPFAETISKVENGAQFSPDNFLPSSGTCPAPKKVVLRGNTYEISYDFFCRYAESIKAIVVTMALITAGFIILGNKNV